MENSKVSIVRVEDYKSSSIHKALKKSFSLIGSLDQIFPRRSKIFVKINHLSTSSPPESCIITHPVFTQEVLRILLEFGHEIIVGDDIYTKDKDGFLISGYRKVCEELGVRLVNLKESGFQEIECKGEVLKKAFISPLVLEADYVLNLPKFKTHSLTVFTGAVKNLFGIIPQGQRLHYHRLFSRNEIFSQMLVDIFSCAPPHLTIMDAIEAMEGEGPSAGNPKKLGVIIASQDAVAVDAVAAKIGGLNPLDIYTTLHAHERRQGTGEIKNITIAGEKIGDVEVNDFKHSAIAIGLLKRKIPSSLYAYLQNQLILIPKVLRDNCRGCLECINICPTGAAQLDQGLAWIEKAQCIHCMCCHEVCLFHAIKLKQLFLGKIIKACQSWYKRLISLFY